MVEEVKKKERKHLKARRLRAVTGIRDRRNGSCGNHQAEKTTKKRTGMATWNEALNRHL